MSPGGLFAATLTGLSAVIPNYVLLQVAPDVHPGWYEPPCLWTLLIAPPSTNKSLYHKLTTDPLENYDEELREASASAIEAFANAKPKSSRGKPPPNRCLIVDDVTTPALRDLLRDNPDRLMVSSEEAAMLINMGLTGRGIFNKAYNGESQRADRKSVRSTRVRGACLSMLISSHPDVVRLALAAPIQDGYWQRFIPIAVGVEEPQAGSSCLPGTTNYGLYVEAAMRSDAVLNRASDISENSASSRHTILSFSPKAQAVFDGCRNDIQKLSKVELVDQALGSHIKKLDKVIARVALILHFASTDWGPSWGRDAMSRYICSETVQIARRIVIEYFLPQIYLFYSDYHGLGTNDNTRAAALEIVSRGLKKFSASELKRPKDYESAVKALEAANWIRPTKLYGRSYEVNPNVFTLAEERYGDRIAEQANARAQISKIESFGKFY